MVVADIHPGIADLESFALGTLDDDSLVDVESHIAECASCQKHAAVITGDSFVGLLRQAHSRIAQYADAMTEAVGQAQTPTPVAGSGDTLAPGVTLDIPADAEMVDSAPAELARHERYRVGRLLGKGGMGSVYLAEHLVMRRTVAVKVINRAYTARPAVVERFRREVRAAARLSHPNIVTTYDAEDAGDTHFLVMEYAEGVSLARLARERGPLPVAEACAYVRQAALGLQHAHERGMVHRDIKPENLIWLRGRHRVVKVLDFGLAALTAECGDDLTDTNVIMGTPDYMAPEQAEDVRSADIRADVYSLGCTLYYLLTGNVPHPAATSLQKILAHRECPLVPLRKVRPEVQPALDRVVARMLAKKPEDRFQTPADVAAALSPFATKAAPAPMKPRRRVRVAVLAALLAGVLFAAGMVYRIQTDKGELVITTDSDDVEVVIKQGGKVVHIIDAKTDKQITLALRSGTYELELKGAPEGLKLDIDKATLTRGEKVLARIESVVKGPEVAVQPPAEKKGGEVQRFVGHRDSIAPVAFSPDGRLVLTGGFSVSHDGDCDLQLWDVATGKELRRFRGHRNAISSATFSRDGKRIVSGSYWRDPSIIVWDVESGRLVQRFTHFAGVPVGIYRVAFSKDGRHVFSCSDDRTLRMWEVETGKEVKRFGKHAGAVRCLAVSHDGRLLACSDLDSGGGDAAIRLWEIESGQEIRRFNKIPGEGAIAIAFSPDDSRIVSGDYDNSVRLWDVGTGKLIRRFEGGSGSVAFAPDGRRILSASGDQSVRLWDVETGKELYRFTEHTAAIHLVDFSPDGRYAISSSADNTARIWRLPDPLPAAKGKP